MTRENDKLKNKLYCDKLVFTDFYDEIELLEEVLSKAEILKDEHTVDIFAKADLIEFLFIELLNNDYSMKYIDFNKIDYISTYHLTILRDRQLYIEQAYTKDGSIYDFDSTYSYLFEDDCDRNIIDKCYNNSTFPTLFNFSNKPDFEGYISDDELARLIENCNVCEFCGGNNKDFEDLKCKDCELPDGYNYENELSELRKCFGCDCNNALNIYGDIVLGNKIINYNND